MSGITSMTFEQALCIMKGGHYVAREGWLPYNCILLQGLPTPEIRKCTINLDGEVVISRPYNADSEDLLAQDWKVIY